MNFPEHFLLCGGGDHPHRRLDQFNVVALSLQTQPRSLPPLTQVARLNSLSGMKAFARCCRSWLLGLIMAVLFLLVVRCEAAGAGNLPLQLKVTGTHIVDTNGNSVLLHILQAIEGHRWSYTAWDLHNGAGPSLISDWNYTPSPRYGVYVKQLLAGRAPAYTPPAEPSGRGAN